MEVKEKTKKEETQNCESEKVDTMSEEKKENVVPMSEEKKENVVPMSEKKVEKPSSKQKEKEPEKSKKKQVKKSDVFFICMIVLCALIVLGSVGYIIYALTQGVEIPLVHWKPGEGIDLEPPSRPFNL